jgi:uncharacterized membrane protein
MSHPPNRKKLVDRLGKNGFMGFYSAVSFATLIPLVVLYVRYGRGKGPLLFKPILPLRITGNVFKYLGGISFALTVANPSPVAGPADAMNDAQKQEQRALASDPVGFTRITRHGTFMSFALLGVGQALSSGIYGNVLFWAGFPVFWYIGSLHQDYRQKQEGRLPDEFYSKTSLLPFQAIAEGRNSFTKAWQEFDKRVLAVALIVPWFLL